MENFVFAWCSFHCFVHPVAWHTYILSQFDSVTYRYYVWSGRLNTHLALITIPATFLVSGTGGHWYIITHTANIRQCQNLYKSDLPVLDCCKTPVLAVVFWEVSDRLPLEMSIAISHEIPQSFCRNSDVIIASCAHWYIRNYVVWWKRIRDHYQPKKLRKTCLAAWARVFQVMDDHRHSVLGYMQAQWWPSLCSIYV